MPGCAKYGFRLTGLEVFCGGEGAPHLRWPAIRNANLGDSHESIGANRLAERKQTHNSGKSKWGLSNGGLRPLSAICAQSSTIVHFCGPFGALSEGNFRHKMTTRVAIVRQMWTSTLSPIC